MTVPTTALDLEIPDLTFAVERVEPLRYAATPALAFRLRITRAGGGRVEAISLQVQLRLSAGGRRYEAGERSRLAALFGRGDQWARSVGSLHWTNVTAIVPPFEDSTTIELPVGLTYDFEVTSTQYLHALEGGEVPVDLLFSGTLFYIDADGYLQAAMIPWEKEARHPLPVSVWHQAMDEHFPDAAWLRISRQTLTRLQEYRSGSASPTWDHALDGLLGNRK